MAVCQSFFQLNEKLIQFSVDYQTIYIIMKMYFDKFELRPSMRYFNVIHVTKQEKISVKLGMFSLSLCRISELS